MRVSLLRSCIVEVIFLEESLGVLESSPGVVFRRLCCSAVFSVSHEAVG